MPMQRRVSMWVLAKPCRSDLMRADAPSVPVKGVAQATLKPAPRRRSPALRRAFPYLLLAPALAYLLVITLYPGLFAIYQSLFVVKFRTWEWNGLGNYSAIVRDREFWAALGNTAIIGGISLCLQTGIALSIAYFAYRDPFIRGWRIVYLRPMLFMPSAVAFIWKLAFNDAPTQEPRDGERAGGRRSAEPRAALRRGVG